MDNMGLVLAIVGAALAALLSGLGSAKGVGLEVRPPQVFSRRICQNSLRCLFFRFFPVHRAFTASLPQ